MPTLNDSLNLEEAKREIQRLTNEFTQLKKENTDLKATVILIKTINTSLQQELTSFRQATKQPSEIGATPGKIGQEAQIATGGVLGSSRQTEFNKADLQPLNPELSKRTYGNVTSSNSAARYAYIPVSALDSLAARFEFGRERHGPNSYNALQNPDAPLNTPWIIDRLEHVIKHCFTAIYKIAYDPYWTESDDDAGAILFGGSLLAERRRLEKLHSAATEPKTQQPNRP